jgi:3-deoxy-D-manno-octulosonate 8-phosphate phosphatase (KDO 8-P phosphatase)
MLNEEELKQKAKKIKLLLTDCDGVLTDGGVYYGENGEAFKRFNIKDGMAVERLRQFAGVDVGIITGEMSPSVAKRAEKLKITELHLGIKDKPRVLAEIMAKHNLQASEIAYIGDDTNDVEVLKMVGLSASPADGISFAKDVANYTCKQNGGHGCFRELAEFIIANK